MQPAKPITMHYQTFLFAMWRESAAENVVAPRWRFSLTDPHTMHRVGFRNLEELLHYLQQQTQSENQMLSE